VVPSLPIASSSTLSRGSRSRRFTVSRLRESELANMVFAIMAINAWNRLMIAARVQPGHYQAGMLEAAA
jgi:hypothetical protein